MPSRRRETIEIVRSPRFLNPPDPRHFLRLQHQLRQRPDHRVGAVRAVAWPIIAAAGDEAEELGFEFGEDAAEEGFVGFEQVTITERA